MCMEQLHVLNVHGTVACGEMCMEQCGMCMEQLHVHVIRM